MPRGFTYLGAAGWDLYRACGRSCAVQGCVVGSAAYSSVASEFVTFAGHTEEVPVAFWK